MEKMECSKIEKFFNIINTFKYTKPVLCTLNVKTNLFMVA